MGRNIYSANSNDSTTDAEEQKDDEGRKEESADCSTTGKIIAFPVDVLGGGWSIVGDKKLFVVENSSLVWFIDATATAASHASVATCIEKVVLVEIVEALNFGFFKLEVDVG